MSCTPVVKRYSGCFSQRGNAVWSLALFFSLVFSILQPFPFRVAVGSGSHRGAMLGIITVVSGNGSAKMVSRRWNWGVTSIRAVFG